MLTSATSPGTHVTADLSLSTALRHLLTGEEDHLAGVPFFRLSDDFGGYTVARRYLWGPFTFHHCILCFPHTTPADESAQPGGGCH